MTELDMLAGEPHFVDHLAAVWIALPEAARGSFVVHGGQATALVARAATHGIAARVGLPPDGGPVLAASIGDLKTAERIGRRQLALMEHGAGQSYAGHSETSARAPSYAGGYGRPASLFLHPNEHAAARDRGFYRRARVEVVGSPMLDALPAREPAEPGLPVVALAWHFEATVSPEARPAFVTFRPGLVELTRRYRVLGSGHPRIIDRLAPWYRSHGIEVVPDLRDVMRRADVLVFDNTSAGFLFAASGRPVVVCDAPTYRRNVNHGLRFWECVGGPDGTGAARLGPRIREPRQLQGAVERALVDAPADATARELALDIVYPIRTGAAKRAAGVLVEWLEGPMEARIAA